MEEEADFVDEVLPVPAEAEDTDIIEEGIGFVEVTPPLGEDIDEVVPEAEDEWPA